MVTDLIATSAAFALFALFIFVPGYVFGWLLDVFGFRRRALPARLAISVPVSVGICPILTYLLWRWSLAGVWTMYAACWIGFLALLFHERQMWLSRPKVSKRVAILLAIVSGWVLLGLLCVVDLQVGNRLYLPTVAYDYMLRTAFTSAITRTGVPPHNPYFFPGQPVILRYHYFWYLPCSLVDQLGGALVSARHAMLASTLWCGIGLMAIVPLYLRFFQPKGPVNLERRMLVGVALLGVTGLDIVPIALIGLVQRRPVLSIEGWNNPIISWVASVLWAPHHVAGFIACLTGFLLLWYVAPMFRDRIYAGVAAGFMFASAVGLSVYVTFVFAVFLLIWLVINLLRKHRHSVVVICVAGVVALVASSPYLLELSGSSTSQQNGGGPFVQFAIREFTVAQTIVETSWPQQPWLVPIANLLLLRMNYMLELGFFFTIGLMQWRRMRIGKDIFNHKEFCGFTMAACSILLCTFLRSGVISFNDLGWRGFLVAQFILLIWAAELWDDGFLPFHAKIPPVEANTLFGGTRRPPILALLVLGVAGSVYEVCMARFYYVRSSTSGDRTYLLRQIYQDLKKRLPEQAVVQQNPNVVPGDVFYGLYADRQAAAETSQCGAVFGGDPALCGSVITRINDLFEKPAALDPHAVDAACKDLSIDALVVKDSDKVWANKSSWVWNKQPVLANDYARAFLCGRTAARERTP